MPVYKVIDSAHGCRVSLRWSDRKIPGLYQDAKEAVDTLATSFVANKLPDKVSFIAFLNKKGEIELRKAFLWFFKGRRKEPPIKVNTLASRMVAFYHALKLNPHRF